jgi:predicted anti-sigma-YlaC factor YlaD
MITEYTRRQGHERFKKLAALAVCGALTRFEWSDLKAHLRNCRECREACQQYLTLTTEGMPALSAVYSQPQEQEAWDDTATRKKLLARVRASQQSNSVASAVGAGRTFCVASSRTRFRERPLRPA